MRVHCLAWLAAVLGGVAHAEQLPLWELGFGAGALTAPDYRGSDERHGYLLPIPYVIYRGDVVKIDRSGIYGRLLERGRIKLDLSGDAGVPVDSEENAARAGMPDLDPTFELGPSVEVCISRDCAGNRVVQLRFPMRAVFATDFSHTDSIGGVFNPHINLDVKDIGPGGGWNLGAALGVLFASKRYHDYYYSVAPGFATPSRPAYEATGGLSGVRVVLAVSRRFERMWVGAFARFDDLSNAAFTGSPLVTVERSFMAGLGVAWVFAKSETLVEAKD